MWRSIGAKATGAAHATDGVPCQDAFAHAALAADLVAIAVADGAGSAPFAKSGADIAVDRAVQYLHNVSEFLTSDASTWVPAVRGAFDAARGSIIDFGRAQGIDARQFATTLQVALLGQTAYCYGRIGDGGGVGRFDGALIPLAPAPANGFVNETTFLTSGGSAPDVVFRADHLSECAIFTDGLQHLAMQLSEWKPHDPFFSPLFQFVRTTPDVGVAQESLGAYLRTDKVDKRTHDDRTLVVSVWTGDRRVA